MQRQRCLSDRQAEGEKMRKRNPAEVVDKILDDLIMPPKDAIRFRPDPPQALACNFCQWSYPYDPATMRVAMVDHLLGEHPDQFLEKKS